MENYYLAVDIGASSGRHILGTVKDGTISLEAVSYTHLEEEQPARAAAVIVSAIANAIVFFIVNPPSIVVCISILVNMHKR